MGHFGVRPYIFGCRVLPVVLYPLPHLTAFSELRIRSARIKVEVQVSRLGALNKWYSEFGMGSRLIIGECVGFIIHPKLLFRASWISWCVVRVWRGFRIRASPAHHSTAAAVLDNHASAAASRPFIVADKFLFGNKSWRGFERRRRSSWNCKCRRRCRMVWRRRIMLRRQSGLRWR